MASVFSSKPRFSRRDSDGLEMIGSDPLRITQELTAVFARGEHQFNFGEITP
jgi:hypothetical protein